MTTFRSNVAKIVVIGDSTVGKTSLIVSFSEGEYKSNTVTTLGVELAKKIVEIDGKKITIEMLDTAGQERFINSLASSYFHGVTGIILAYAIDDRKTFENIEKWLNVAQQKAQENVCKVLVATKIDLPRIVNKNEGEALAQRFGMNFFEVSAKQDINVEYAFYELAREIKEKILDPRVNEEKVPSVQLHNAPNERVKQAKGNSCSC